MGLAYLHLGQPQPAVESYDQAIGLNPQDADAFSGRALAYTLLGKEAEADQDVVQAVELGVDPDALREAIQGLKERAQASSAKEP